MIRSLRSLAIASLCLLSIHLFLSGATVLNAHPADGEVAPAETATAVVPVEDDMHEFMEYVFQPPYKRLKAAMAAQPTDNQGWKTIKSDSLILAEGGNLLLGHLPTEKSADWVKHSVQVRDVGGQLYRAAKAKDFATARKHYEVMIDHCNACHRQFEKGKHILTP